MTSLGDLLLFHSKQNDRTEKVSDRDSSDEIDKKPIINKETNYQQEPTQQSNLPQSSELDSINSQSIKHVKDLSPSQITATIKQEPKVFHRYIEKHDADDVQSNASSTDDYVRELLDPDDRPKNVWHVVEGPKVPIKREESKEDHGEQSYIKGEPYDVVLGNQPSTPPSPPSPQFPQQPQSSSYSPTSLNRVTNLPGDTQSVDEDLVKLDKHHERDGSRDRRYRSDRKEPSSRHRSRGHDRDRHDSPPRRHHREDSQRDTRYRDESNDRHRSSKRRRRDDDTKEEETSVDVDPNVDATVHDSDGERGSHRRHHSKHRRDRNGHRRDHRRRSNSRSSRNSSSRHSRRDRSRSRSRSPINKRNSRTILVMQLSPKVDSRDLEEFFCDTGKVREVRLIMDSKTRRHKGLAYIEFESSSSAKRALSLDGKKLYDIPVVIQSTQTDIRSGSAKAGSSGDNYQSSSLLGAQAFSNMAQSSSHSNSRSYLPPNSYRIYVGGLNVSLTEEMIRSVFEPFGPIVKLELMKDRTTNISRGYAFITYAESEDGQLAVQSLDGFEFAGKNLRVSKSADKNDRSLGGANSNNNDNYP